MPPVEVVDKKQFGLEWLVVWHGQRRHGKHGPEIDRNSWGYVIRNLNSGECSSPDPIPISDLASTDLNWEIVAACHPIVDHEVHRRGSTPFSCGPAIPLMDKMKLLRLEKVSKPFAELRNVSGDAGGGLQRCGFHHFSATIIARDTSHKHVRLARRSRSSLGGSRRLGENHLTVQSATLIVQVAVQIRRSMTSVR
jgi:hypothetical protein